MKKFTAVFFLLFLLAGKVSGQTSLLGGASINLDNQKPLKHIRAFGGLEFKIPVGMNLSLFFAPQYAGISQDNFRIESGIMPLGISWQFNELWDDKTNLFRFIDLSLGPYGGYIYKVKENHEYIDEGFYPVDYGVHISAKFRLFVFYPLYISYQHSLTHKFQNSTDIIFTPSTLQAGAYFPISYILKYY